jgi:hypothetical protein
VKILNKLSLAALFIVILLSACQRENLDVTIPQEPNYQADTVNVNPFLGQMRTGSPDTIFIVYSTSSDPSIPVN